ncbi:DNA polymerase III subunit alpha [Geotalea sp. SG265]|uniref:DNA polymerase III subunit alpha n=1 Tax=Geotalea sp. SG265 TaxID=2922867 RepID=UPI001FB0228D|nr:DNA polymerase III subunit alpha [Geotalea sp. SG265]
MDTLLHAKSHYSLGYGTSSVAELVERAATLGYRAVALTDLDNLYGQVQFHHLCHLHGIAPITGIELRPGFDPRGGFGSKQGRLILLAADVQGYRSLCQMISSRRGAFQCADLEPVALARRHPAGLVALSDDPAVVERLMAGGCFSSERLGLLLIRPARGREEPLLLQTARRLAVPVVADLDAVFLKEEDHALHVLQRAVHQGIPYGRALAATDGEDTERRLLSPAEAAALYADLPEAVAAASRLGGMCRFNLQAVAARPALAGRAGKKAQANELEDLCREALAETTVWRHWSAAHGARLEEELRLFKRLGFSGYMLVVAEILAHCRKQGVPVVIRGSAVSSLTLQVLGGLSVDPLAHGLLFERFLHREKTAWPDVDLDLPWHRRDGVIDWVYERYGRERVAMVATHHTFRWRSALREGLKAWGAAPALIERLLAALPADDLAAEEMDFLDLAPLGKEVPALTGRELELLGGAAGLEGILSLIGRLVGQPRHVAVHPGGIVVSRAPLVDLVPLERAPKGVVMTQYDLVGVARLGLVKIDLLGNRCLSELDETFSLVPGRRTRSLQTIPLDDRRTLRLVDRAATIGCFQLESPTMRSLLARMPVRSIGDIIAALALIRPGTAAGAVKSIYIRRAHGEEPDQVPFAQLQDRLEQTHGLFLYEEDLMLLLSRIGGISLEEADELRRAIVKSGGDQSMLSRLEAGFLRKAARRSSADIGTCREAWRTAARLAAYSFNKAHAASYGVLAYCAAYAKAHFPVQFACAVINHHQGLYPLRTLAAEFIRIGVRIAAPHVNGSALTARCEKREKGLGVRVGLAGIKGLSRRTAAAILGERDEAGPFRSLADLLGRARPSRGELSSLILSGACDGLFPLAPGLYPFAHETVVQWLEEGGAPAGLNLLSMPSPAAEGPRLELYRSLVRVKNELRYLSMHLSAHPLVLLRDEATRHGCVTVASTHGASGGQSVKLAALVAAMRRVITKQGILQFFTIEDETGLLEAVVLPPVYRRLGNRIVTPGPFLVEGILRREQGAAHLEVMAISPFHERKRPYSGLA